MSMPPKFEMIKEFIDEVGSYIPTLINGLESLKKEPKQSEALEEFHVEFVVTAINERTNKFALMKQMYRLRRQ